MEEVYNVFGAELPDKDTFFATWANPMSLLDMRKQFKTWDNFVHSYYVFVKEKSAPEVKTVVAPVVTKAVPDAAK